MDGLETRDARRLRPPRGPHPTEASTYLLGLMALTTATLAAVAAWELLLPIGRVVMLGSAAVVLLAGGAPAPRSHHPAVVRIGSGMWLLSAGCLAGAVFVASTELWDLGPAAGVLLAGAATAAYAGALWAQRRAPLQQAAVFGGLYTLAVGTVLVLPGEAAGWRAASIGMLVSGAWIALAARGGALPRPAGVVLGILGVLVAVMLGFGLLLGTAFDLLAVIVLMAAVGWEGERRARSRDLRDLTRLSPPPRHAASRLS